MSLKKNKIIISSIIPDFKDGKGHMLPYQKFFIEALNLIDIDYRVNYFSKSKIYKYKNWSNNIYMGRITPYKIDKFSISLVHDFIKLTRSMKSALAIKKHKMYKKKFGLIESFGLIEFLAFTFAIILLKDCNPIILFRHFPKGIVKKIIFRFGIFLFDIFKKSPLFLSDSNKLSIELGKFLKKNIITMPIPLNINLTKKSVINNDDKNIKIWWPGPPRIEKGLSEIVRFCNHLNEKEKFVFYTSAETEGVRSNENIKLLPTNLSMFNYYSLFNFVNIIYLPYSAEQYSHSTSNIFVESIIHEKITIVSSGTWMSDELGRFGLDNLVINKYSIPELKKKFDYEESNKLNYKKIRSMKSDYLKFHSLNNYSLKLKKIISA